MKVMKTLTSSRDDINIALFHPHIGRGFIYGTKQGRIIVAATDFESNVAASNAVASDVVASIAVASDGAASDGAASTVAAFHAA